MYRIDACLVCGEKQRTIVAEYNLFIFMDSMWQSDLARFDGSGLPVASRAAWQGPWSPLGHFAS